MEISKNSTSKELIEIAKKTCNYDKLLDIIYHQNANDDVFKEVIIRISKFSNNESNAKIFNSIIYRGANANILIEIIKKSVDKDVIINAINSPNATEEVFRQGINRAKKFSNFKLKAEILSRIIDAGAKSNLLIEIIKVGDSKTIVKAVKSKYANDNVYAEAISFAPKINNFEAKAEVLNSIIDVGVKPSLLTDIIKVGSSKTIIKAVKSKTANEEVFEEAISFASKASKSEDKNEILNSIIDAGANADTLVRLIRRGNSATIAKAVDSPNANHDVFNSAISQVAKESQSSLVYENIIKKDVDASTLQRIVGAPNNSRIIVKAIEHKNANKLVYEEAIKKVSSLDAGAQDAVLDTVINLTEDPDILVNIIAISKSHKKIISALNSPYADKSVLDAAIASAEWFKHPEHKSNILNAIERNKERIESKEWVNNVVNESQQETQGRFSIEKEDNVTERLRRNVEDGFSTMLWGLSGVGKTSRVRAIDPTATIIRLKNGMLPEEVVGGKEPNGEPGELYPPQWYITLCKKCEAEPNRMHILFIEELTNVKETIKSLVWDVIEDRCVNGNAEWSLPENCAIVAAGNRPEESTAVVTDYNGSVMAEPLHRRFDFHIEIPFDVEEWQQWALETNPKTGFLNIHPIVLSFCIGNIDKVMFSNMNVDDVTQPCHDPRRWEKLSKVIFKAEERGGKYNHVSNQRIAECIGKDLAPAFIAYYQKEPLNMELLEKGLYTEDNFKNIDDKLYALSSVIADNTKSDELIVDFIGTCLGEEYTSIYYVMKKQRREMMRNVETPIINSNEIKSLKFTLTMQNN